jgi:hypothetical protein
LVFDLVLVLVLVLDLDMNLIFFFFLLLSVFSLPEILRDRLLVAIHTDSDSMNADNPAPNTMRAGHTRASAMGLRGLVGQPSSISIGSPSFFEQLFLSDANNASGGVPRPRRSSSGSGFS